MHVDKYADLRKLVNDTKKVAEEFPNPEEIQVMVNLDQLEKLLDDQSDYKKTLEVISLRPKTKNENKEVAQLKDCAKQALRKGTPLIGLERLSDELRDFLKGMAISVDISTGDDDYDHRLFGTVCEVMDCREEKNGVIFLVHDPRPNFNNDKKIVEQAVKITKILCNEFFSGQYIGNGPIWESDNLKVQKCWKIAKQIQESYNNSDVENAIAELDNIESEKRKE